MTKEWFQPKLAEPISSIELFAGCGAMAYGLSRAGIRAVKMIEASERAIATINHNRSNVADLHHEDAEAQDIRDVDWDKINDKVRILTGGPPCECFGIGGNKRGAADHRNQWPEVVRAVRKIEPEAFLFENVAGMSSASVGNYAEKICRALADPAPGLSYHVISTTINTADYGAAQNRRRLLIAGFRVDLFPFAPSFPRATHSYDALIWDKWITGSYWKRHGIQPPASGPTQHERKIRDSVALAPPPFKPHRTVRDAIASLGDPNGENNHLVRDGVRFYKGHTGSDLDLPAKALKAGDHGVPGGENAIRYTDGSGRYFTVREAARLQGLPDAFSFPHGWSENMRQLGNALPVEVAEYFGRWLADQCRLRDMAAPDEVARSIERQLVN